MLSSPAVIHSFLVESKKTEAFNYLRDLWAKENDPRKIIKDLEVYQDIYLDLVYGTSFIHQVWTNFDDMSMGSSCDERIWLLINGFYRMGAPSVVYPFIMKLFHENQRGNEIQ